MALSPPSLSLGVEEEYLLVDPASRDLVAAPPEDFMRCCQDASRGAPRHEFLQAQVEVGTRVCRDVGEVRRELPELRAAVARTAQRVRHGADRRLDPPVRALARAGAGRQGPLPAARPRHAGARPRAW